MRRKAVKSGLLGGTLALVLLSTGAPAWLVLVGVAAGFMVLVRYWVLALLDDDPKPRPDVD